MRKSSVSRPNYFEAIIQLRPKNKKLIEYAVKQILNRQDVFISKIVEEKYGMDIYISSQRYARALGKKLTKAFKGKIVTSRAIYGPKQGKTRYRVTILFKME